MRYWLVVPKNRVRVAIQAGCHYSKDHHLWYVDTPFWYNLTLEDFANWKPTRYSEDALHQIKWVEESKDRRRVEKERRFKIRKARAGAKFAVTRNWATTSHEVEQPPNPAQLV